MTEAQRRAAIARARNAMARVVRLENATLRSILAGLRQTRGELLARLAASGTPFDKAHAMSLFRETDAVLDAFEREFGREIRKAQDYAAGIAADGMAEKLAAQGIEPLQVRPVIPTGAITVAGTDAVADLIKGVSQGLRDSVRRELRRALYGELSLAEFERRIGRGLRSPGPFGSTARRAETIVRNELADSFALAEQAQREEMSKRGVVFRKRWLTARDGRVRPSHAALDNVAVDRDAFFLVGGFEAACPRDPALPAEESINCRCVVLDEIENIAPPKVGHGIHEVMAPGSSLALTTR